MKFYLVKFKEDGTTRRVWCLTEDDAEAIKEQYKENDAYILEVKPPIGRLAFLDWLNDLELRRDEVDDEVPEAKE